MSAIAISAKDVGKIYQLGRVQGYATFRESLMNVAGRIASRERRNAPDMIWALRHVGFDIREGEVVGIIGRNGAGKSTLLKVLTRITDPTEGRIELRGRVGSLLEVGTGFHPELTGRENIFLNGAILGMSRKEIRKKFDEIVAFADIDRFLETPVKRYSSGMYVRLAFAVAAHLEPEILLVDEVLAVGDVAFQQRCLGKMREISGSGRTVIFVSHNMGAIRTLCDRCILLAGGEVTFDGDVDQAITRYLAIADDGRQSLVDWTPPAATARPDAALYLERVTVRGSKSIGGTFRPDESVDVTINYRLDRRMSGLRFVLSLLTVRGEVAFATTDEASRAGSDDAPGMYRARCTIPANLLNRTGYLIRIHAGRGASETLLEPTEVGRFFVEGPGNEGAVSGRGNWPGVVSPKIAWDVTPVEQPASMPIRRDAGVRS
jgi:lipopolysaccharide transport system ATP-binding protein